MTNLLVQNFIQNKHKKVSSAIEVRPTIVPAPVIHPVHSLGVKPGKPKGYLVKENVLQAAVSNVKAYGDSAKFLYNAAIKGEGNDYSVGRINDLTTRLGSLGIASVLAVSKASPVAKGMEFVGLGSWFAAMAIWPQIIGAPIKWTKGVDINQQYVDSQGRRKQFFQDPQYLLWDLYSDKKLNKIGDKLGVPRDIEDRKTAIQKKIKQVATQGNTLAMLTAGFTTPVIASLVSDQLQKHIVVPQIEKARKAKGEKILNSLDASLKQPLEKLNKYDTYLKRIDEIIGSDNNYEIVSNEKYNQLSDFIKADVREELVKLGAQKQKDDNISGINVKNALKKRFILHNSEYIKELNQTFNKIVKEDADFTTKLNKIIGNDASKNLSTKEYDQLTKMLTKKYSGTGINDSITETLKELGVKDKNCFEVDTSGLKDGLKKGLKLNDDELNKMLGRLSDKSELDISDTTALMSKVKRIKGTPEQKQRNLNVTKLLIEENKKYKIDTNKIKNLVNLTDGLIQFRSQVEKYEAATIKNIADSMTANSWGKLPTEYLKAINLDKKQIKELATNKVQVHKVLLKHFNEMTPEQASAAIQKMSKIAGEAINKEEEALGKLINSMLKVKQATVQSSELNGLWALADGFDKNINLASRRLELKVLDTKSSFVRPIKTLDIFSRDLKGDVNRIIEGKFYDIKTDIKRDDFVKNISNYVKNIVLTNNGVDNWTTKMEQVFEDIPKGVQDVRLLDDIAELVFGKMSDATEKAINNKESTNKFSIHNFIKKFKFGKMSNVTEKAIDKQDLATKFNNHNLIMKFKLLNITNPIMPFMDKNYGDYKKGNSYYNDAVKDLKVEANKYMGTPFKFLAQMTGKDVTDMFVSAAQQFKGYNKWLKTTGIIGGATLGISALAISQFGKKNSFNPDAYTYKGGK